jgi:hypothetical protein
MPADSPPPASSPDPLLAAAADAVARGHAGDRAGARRQLHQLWIGIDDDDPLHRCAVAHALADVQDDPLDELRWDRAALDAAATLTDDRLAASGAPASVAALLPSLHLNLADVLLRLRRLDEARSHLESGRASLGALAPDGYRSMIEVALERIDVALEHPLPGNAPAQ